MDKPQDEATKIGRATEGSEPEVEGHRRHIRATEDDQTGEPEVEGHRRHFRATEDEQPDDTETDSDVEGHSLRGR
jgi:hypothetical protein